MSDFDSIVLDITLGGGALIIKGASFIVIREIGQSLQNGPLTLDGGVFHK